MKKLILTAAAFALSASFALAQDMVRMGTEGAYPPYNFINDSGEVDGFEIELGNELCARAGLTCRPASTGYPFRCPICHPNPGPYCQLYLPQMLSKKLHANSALYLPAWLFLRCPTPRHLLPA